MMRSIYDDLSEFIHCMDPLGVATYAPKNEYGLETMYILLSSCMIELPIKIEKNHMKQFDKKSLVEMDMDDLIERIDVVMTELIPFHANDAVNEKIAKYLKSLVLFES